VTLHINNFIGKELVLVFGKLITYRHF